MMVPNCQCTTPGYCSTLGREVTAGIIAECRSNVGFRQRMLGLAIYGETHDTAGNGPYVAPPLKPKCIHLGEVNQTCGCGDRTRDIRHCLCEATDKERCWRSPMQSVLPDVASCERCPHYDCGPPPSCGVVIGSYNLPNLVALQVKLIRNHNADVPILIVDDCSDGYGHTPGANTHCGKLRNIAATHRDVMLFTHPTRFGHASGDLSKFWTGIQWAAIRKIKFLAALSQRMLIDQHHWLFDGARSLVESGLPLLAQPSTGQETFPLRTEAMVLDVDKWNRPDILDHLMPREMTPIPGEWGVAAEHVLYDDLRDRLGGKFHPWPALNTDRYQRHPGIVWHCSASRDEYAAIHRRYGVEMDAGFTTDGWRSHQKEKYKG